MTTYSTDINKNCSNAFFFHDTILVCYYCTAFPYQAVLIMVLSAVWDKAIKSKLVN